MKCPSLPVASSWHRISKPWAQAATLTRPLLSDDTLPLSQVRADLVGQAKAPTAGGRYWNFGLEARGSRSRCPQCGEAAHSLGAACTGAPRCFVCARRHHAEAWSALAMSPDRHLHLCPSSLYFATRAQAAKALASDSAFLSSLYLAAKAPAAAVCSGVRSDVADDLNAETESHKGSRTIVCAGMICLECGNVGHYRCSGDSDGVASKEALTFCFSCGETGHGGGRGCPAEALRHRRVDAMLQAALGRSCEPPAKDDSVAPMPSLDRAKSTSLSLVGSASDGYTLSSAVLPALGAAAMPSELFQRAAKAVCTLPPPGMPSHFSPPPPGMASHLEMEVHAHMPPSFMASHTSHPPPGMSSHVSPPPPPGTTSRATLPPPGMPSHFSPPPPGMASHLEMAVHAHMPPSIMASHTSHPPPGMSSHVSPPPPPGMTSFHFSPTPPLGMQQPQQGATPSNHEFPNLAPQQPAAYQPQLQDWSLQARMIETEARQVRARQEAQEAERVEALRVAAWQQYNAQQQQAQRQAQQQAQQAQQMEAYRVAACQQYNAQQQPPGCLR